jgi:predicted Zn-dependent protease
MSRHGGRISVALAIGALILAGCVTTGPGGQKSFVIVSTDEEVAMGRQMDTELKAQEKLLADTAWQSYLAGIGQKIVAVSDRKDLEYEYNVIESDQINAFAAPGGFVYFYTGILREIDNEAEVAAVMAHEISHVVARHGVKKLQTVMGVSVLLDIALGNSGQLTQQAVGVVLGLAINGYGRSMELEADQYGVEYMTRAGYAPRGAIEMFTKLAELSGGGEQGVFEKLTSTHPETSERIAKIQAQIAAMPPSVNNLPEFADRYRAMRARLPAPSPKS